MDLLITAYQSFKLQTWPNKELVIVCDAPCAELKTLADSNSEIVYVEIPAIFSLGELRNISIANSNGDFICQWDDDDLYAPERISVQMNILLESSVDAVFLKNWVMWWMQRNLICISHSRIWEGSMLARRSIIPIYPSVKKGEDSTVTQFILQNFQIAVIDCPELYCYRVTGENTWQDEHFERLFSKASTFFKTEDFSQVFTMPCFTSIQS
jgi:glycosyltransferase involved in cell wall biosynthesis